MLRCIVCVLACVLLFGGCVAPEQQASLVAVQQAKANSAPARNRLFYIGLALYSESWSENDVVELGNELKQTADFDVVPLIASNFVSNPPKYPVADRATIEQLVQTAAARAGPDDVVLVHISTHGGHDVLASKIDGGQVTAVPGRVLASLLAPLAAQPTVIILSACYSGSLIGDLRSPSPIIITAARADRSSFGCEADAKHTFFGEAELQGFGQRNRSLHQAYTVIRQDVARMEREQDYVPSQPQWWVGSAMKGLYEAPVF